ncbi:hypothetical protein ACJX0J_011677 [Zea mays]
MHLSDMFSAYNFPLLDMELIPYVLHNIYVLLQHILTVCIHLFFYRAYMFFERNWPKHVLNSNIYVLLQHILTVCIHLFFYRAYMFFERNWPIYRATAQKVPSVAQTAGLEALGWILVSIQQEGKQDRSNRVYSSVAHGKGMS